MDDRMKTLSSFFVAAMALTTAGCGYIQQSKFQMSFLPPSPHTASPVVDIVPPPVVHPNPFLKDMPVLLLAEPLPPKHRTRGDAFAQKAHEAFDRGKKLYQKNDIVNARMEFDAAVDWMLEAADADPEGREEYCNEMDDM